MQVTLSSLFYWRYSLFTDIRVEITNMKRKSLISLTVAFAFLILGLTGLLLYTKQKAHFIEMTHTIFGLLFIGFAIFHIKNNWGSIKLYSKDKQSRSFKKELLVALSIAGIVLILSVTNILEPVEEFGNLFAGNQFGGSRDVNFQEKTTRENTAGKAVTLILQKKDNQVFAALSVEVADSTGKITETLFKPEGEIEGPQANLILNTRINTTPPFKLIVTGQGEEEKDKSRQESIIQSLQPGIQSLSLTAISPLKRAYLQVK